MKDFLQKTAHLNRAIISDGFEKTLHILQQRLPLNILKYKTSSQVLDWVIPKKWNIRDAYIKDEKGVKILDVSENPLHVVIGSLSIKKTVSRAELETHLNVCKEYPDAIPYHFKYYELDWGFCMSKHAWDLVQGDTFEVYIEAEHTDDHLLIGEHVIPGETDDSIIFMAHLDHPAQVNDGLAGGAVLMKVAEALKNIKPYFTLKFLFIPETIGSIAYLHNNFEEISSMKGGIFCEMPGTKDMPMVLQHSKQYDTRLDRIGAYVVTQTCKNPLFSPCFKHVVNDDGIFNSPGIDIPCLSLSRSKPLVPEDWFHFPGYHTSMDDLEHFDFEAAEEYAKILQEIIEIINNDRLITRTYNGVPNLSRHNLWVDWREQPAVSQHIDDILYALDNTHTIFDIAAKLDLPFLEVRDFILKLEQAGLVVLGPTTIS